MLLKLLRTGFAVLLAALISLSLTFGMVYYWSSKPVTPGQAKVIDFPRGTSLNELSGLLAFNGLIDRPLFFQILVRFQRSYPKFQAGTYRFEGELTPRRIIEVLKSGKTYTPVVLQYTVPEGFTLKQLTARLVHHRVGTQDTFDALWKDAKFRKDLRVGKSFEGYIYPATYDYRQMPSAKEAITRMVATFFENLPQNYLSDLKAHNLTLDKAVIMASLIELETRFDEERAFVSEVIHNRLRTHQRLGIDAAIIYGIKDYRGDLTWKHLKDASNPYNTRIHFGLPPTAIGSVSTASLQAVLRPSKLGYYYYVVDPDTADGRHHFSKTLSEHNRYVKKLVQKSRQIAGEGR